MKKSPFKVSNQGEIIDENFFIRLKKIEQYYKRLSLENDYFIPNLKSVEAINQILQREMLSSDEVEKAIEIYNETNLKQHHNGTGWYDLRLHLRHLVFVFGKEFQIDENFNLIEKNKS